jgi:hypothetical protein
MYARLFAHHTKFTSEVKGSAQKPQQPRNKKELHMNIFLISSLAVDSHKFKTLSCGA